jgi:uncharacterized protein (TIGR02646 family)
MIHINRDNSLPDQDWLNRADAITTELMDPKNNSTNARNAIIDRNEELWGELKDFLLSISHNKCWYSEAKDAYNHLHVDHFRPKKISVEIDKKPYEGYWWLAFQWYNYRVCGGAGNVRKRDKFAVKSNKATTPSMVIEDEIIYFLDPCEEEDVLKITFNQHGEITPITSTGWDFERSTYTIKSLNLNFKKLKEARKETWIKCSTLLTETQNLMALNDVAPSSLRRGQIKEKIKQLKKLTLPSSAYSATARACLESIGLPWALKIAS